VQIDHFHSIHAVKIENSRYNYTTVEVILCVEGIAGQIARSGLASRLSWQKNVIRAGRRFLRVTVTGTASLSLRLQSTAISGIVPQLTPLLHFPYPTIPYQSLCLHDKPSERLSP
jgi:hypothetical protein